MTPTEATRVLAITLKALPTSEEKQQFIASVAKDFGSKQAAKVLELSKELEEA